MSEAKRPSSAPQATPADLAEARAEALRERLRAATHWDAEYQGHLASHLPMALTALHRLGADAARLDAFAAKYTQQLHPAPAIEPWPVGDAWRGRFGDPAAWPVYRDFFRQWLHNEGAADMLNQSLPWLLQGCGGAAFHGLLRTAHAFAAGEPEELCDALAYWACRWADLPSSHAPHRQSRAPRPAGPATADPRALLPALAALARPTDRSRPLIVLRMAAAVQRRGFEGQLARLAVDGRTLERLGRCAAQLYARSGHFTVLHLVTSAQALRVLQPLLDDPLAGVAAYWRAYAAGVVAAGVDPAAGRAPALLDGPALQAAALASDDEHLIKLVDACQQEQAAYGGAPDWQRAASRAVQQARQGRA
jgi:hypothetical protein